MKRSFIYLVGLLASILPLCAWANSDGAFSVSATDTSLLYLNMLFGTVGEVLTSGSGTTLIADMFSYFNAGIFTFTITIFSYVLLCSIIATANEGKAITEKFNSWILIRSISGIGMLAPLPGGYCMVQIIVMWTVTQGIGLANGIWSKSVYNIATLGGYGATIPTNDIVETPDLVDASSPISVQNIAIGTSTRSYQDVIEKDSQASFINLFRSAYCAQIVYQYDKTAAAINGADTPSSANYGVFINNNNNICFGSYQSDGLETNYNCQCGEYKIADTYDGTTSTFDNTSTELFLSNQSTLYAITESLYTTAQNLYTNINSYNPIDDSTTISRDGASVDLDQVCQVISDSNPDTSTCTYAMTLLDNANTYNAYIANYQASEVDTTSTSDCPDWVSQAQDEGWIMAASHYADLTELNTSCKATSTITDWTVFMPYAINTANIVTDKTQYPCMTTASGYGSSDLCVNANLDKTVMSNWAVVNDSTTYVNASGTTNANTEGGVFTNIFGGSSTSGTVTSYTGIQYLIQTMMPEVTSGVVSQGVFDSYFNTLLGIFLENFVIKELTLETFGFDVKVPVPPTGLSFGGNLFGGTGIIANGGVTLVTYIIGQILGIDMYDGASAKTLFSLSNMQNGGASTNPSCVTCYNNGSLDYSDSTTCGSCVSQDGYGIFGQALKQKNGAAFVDPLSSVASVGRNILFYTTSFLSNLTSNLYSYLSALVTNISLVVTEAAAGLSIIGFFGGFGGGTFNQFIQGASGFVPLIATYVMKMYMVAIFMWMPVVLAIALGFLVIGITLGFYLPFLPFLYYLSGVISWFIAVVEAMVAAPLIAMGVTHPKGHELMGRSEQAIVLLLGVFIRPASMVLGLVTAIALSYAAVYLLNLIFAYAFTEGLVFAVSSDETYSYAMAVLSCMIYIVVYAYSVFAILSQVFSLIYQIPDKVMRWVGTPAETTGRTAVEMTGAVQGGITRSGQGAASSGTGALKSIKQLPSRSEPFGTDKKFRKRNPQPGGGEGGQVPPHNPQAGGGQEGGQVPPQNPPIEDPDGGGD